MFYYQVPSKSRNVFQFGLQYKGGKLGCDLISFPIKITC